MPDKRQRIIAAAIKLFEENGFWNTSTANISREAGIATGTLFRYFSTKDELINELFLELEREIAITIYGNTPEDTDVRTRLKLIWDSYIRWNLENPGKHAIIAQLEVASRISHSVKRQVVDLNQFTVKTFKEGIKQGEIADYPVSFLAAFLSSSSNSVIRQLLSHPGRLPGKKAREQLITIGFETFWKGITP
ncbi:MAG: TetR/AcrR family transcriptional regulator [Ketobacteraceae bacterium]|nr:TetR/AcrR family transcriptional regulator [Ketobacteraceae bacterium]